MKCAACGHEQTPQKFCLQCGVALQPAAPEPEPPSPPKQRCGQCGAYTTAERCPQCGIPMTPRRFI
jgi:rRNA maturation protein Nop10